jgi:hypothetical protein
VIDSYNTRGKSGRCCRRDYYKIQIEIFYYMSDQIFFSHEYKTMSACVATSIKLNLITNSSSMNEVIKQFDDRFCPLTEKLMNPTS